MASCHGLTIGPLLVDSKSSSLGCCCKRFCTCAFCQWSDGMPGAHFEVYNEAEVQCTTNDSQAFNQFYYHQLPHLIHIYSDCYQTWPNIWKCQVTQSFLDVIVGPIMNIPHLDCCLCLGCINCLPQFPKTLTPDAPMSWHKSLSHCCWQSLTNRESTLTVNARFNWSPPLLNPWRLLKDSVQREDNPHQNWVGVWWCHTLRLIGNNKAIWHHLRDWLLLKR